MEEEDKGPEVSDDERITSREVSKPHPWVITTGYRFQPSSRHFIGTIEQKQRELTHNQIQNTYHLFDVAIERQLSKRFSATASIPILFDYRNQLYNPKGIYRTRGIGDMTIGGRAWIFKPPTEGGGNVAVGMSLKLPTGQGQCHRNRHRQQRQYHQGGCRSIDSTGRWRCRLLD